MRMRPIAPASPIRRPGRPRFRLAGGQSASDVFSYTVRDAAGATSTATLTLTVHGLNDAAGISGSATGNVIEAGGLNNASAGTPIASGTLAITDPDAGESHFQAPATLAGTYGSFSFDAATGAWSCSSSTTCH